MSGKYRIMIHKDANIGVIAGMAHEFRRFPTYDAAEEHMKELLEQYKLPDHHISVYPPRDRHAKPDSHRPDSHRTR